MSLRSPPDQVVLEKWERDASRQVTTKRDIIVRTWYRPPIEILGYGSYGIVFSAFDKCTGDRVAVKFITDLFQHETGLRVLREIKILRHLRHENIIRLLDIEDPQNYASFTSLNLVFECMDKDLYHVIYPEASRAHRHRCAAPVSQDAIHRIKSILVQILNGVQHLHNARIIHRDLKPSNVLLDRDNRVKVADLGLARAVNADADEPDVMTAYVVTRWYRAPEVLCRLPYGYPVDMWSVGCIFYEMVVREPLFDCNNEAMVLERIRKEFGWPDIRKLMTAYNADPATKSFLGSLENIGNVAPCRSRLATFSAVLRNEQGLDLLRAMLKVTPHERITACEALGHPFLNDVSTRSAAPANIHVDPFDFGWEKQMASGDDHVRTAKIRALLLQETFGITRHARTAVRRPLPAPAK
ncbi:Protein kinase domain-containing protein [Plasmodiophora brassicae]|uniref:Protein kinase domain-containing protein n=1 Tax=Plasmodiophora brassicae TaxID=37360 RepID=A0A0G4IRU5_PLABS|nr:hypothetical protein PBRA_005988 [Plasmodiophora brassicae]SPQ98092.1 unnamed protein product [Plasmodiophora brassicae]